MEKIDAICQRPSLKEYDKEHKLLSGEETKLIEAAMRAPTCFNMQHWCFVIVRNPEFHQKI